ncbi:MAG: GNAT family N-acetyltransferase [Bacteroidetes bacterium]|nr:GNAT family N-acetyltransferase [Bacteroidota bacterium]
MQIRIAIADDVKGIQRVRHVVKENILSDPSLVPDADVLDYILRRGKGWVATNEDAIIGFSIVSLTDKNVWALFIDPAYEKNGIGRQLHDQMMDWYFEQTTNTCWLSTTPGTRAEGFYRKAGWIETGVYGKGEIRFEMAYSDWQKVRGVN